VAASVIWPNVALRPLLGLLQLAIPAAVPIEERYEISITCCSVDEAHLRALLLTAIGRTPATLHAIHSAADCQSNHTLLQTEISTHGPQNGLIDEIAARLSIEPSVTSLTWSVTSP
jgi:putative Mg2+ transporter-C (MgtC) family protein